MGIINDGPSLREMAARCFLFHLSRPESVSILLPYSMRDNET